MFIIQKEDGSVSIEPINDQLRIQTYRGDEPGQVRLSVSDVRTFVGALTAWANRQDVIDKTRAEWAPGR